jgi:hypothetical protein
MFGLVLSLGVLGCSSSSSSGSAEAACNNFCGNYIAAACYYPSYYSVADCESLECQPLSGTSGACATALVNWYDCRAQSSNADICADYGCDVEFTDVYNNCQ